MEACLCDTGPVIVEISETLLEHPYGGKNEKIRMRLLKISERQ